MNLASRLGLLLILAPGALCAQAYKKLPDWAVPVYEASRKVSQPEDADTWVLLDRTEFAYTGNGEIAIHRCRLVEVLTDRGTGAGVFITTGLGGGASKVKKLKGWNLRPDGDMVKLDSDNVVAVEKPGDSNGVTNERTTGAFLERVVKGSLIAFESTQTETDPGGPDAATGVMEVAPIFRWEIVAATKGGWFTDLKKVSMSLDLRHFAPWIPAPTIVPNVSVAADNVPPLPKEEGATPDAWNVLPRVTLKFMDPDLKVVPDLHSWDGVASWVETAFADKAAARPLPETRVAAGLQGLESIHHWMGSQLTYKQVYMSPERGLVPLSAEQVVRRRYGDCKDLASCFIAAARADGFEAFPVLARIMEGRVEPDEPVTFACFNHVIAAVRLKETLNLPSEVETPAGRFLLVDATARMTPLGRLPADHAKGRLLICVGGKGVWVKVPDAALERPELHATFTATADSTGKVQGTLKLVEMANARALRASVLALDPQDYQRFIFAEVLALPPNARIEVIRHSDPLDVSKPFEVELKLEDPKGFDIHGTEWDLNAMGIFRMVPSAIQRAGRARKFPVEFAGQELFDVQAQVTTPANLRPFLEHKEGGTAFHVYQWDAKSQPQAGGGAILSLKYRNEEKWAAFGFDAKDAGTAEWAKDRHQMQSLVSDALAFELKP